MTKMADYQNRVTIFHEFEFKNSSSKIKISNDDQYVIATGIYAPFVKIFETSNLGLKCERGVDSEIIDF